MEISVRELLIDKGHISQTEVANQIDRMDARSPTLGARVVAHSWTDPAFAKTLAIDAPSAVQSLGIDIGPLNLIALHNTPTLHNMVVCTL